MNIFQTLKERGFVQSHTDPERLESFLQSTERTFYVGFDPTGSSLHVGHLVPVMAMAWLAKAGHSPIAIIGGGRALVGDPSGKDKTRSILDETTIASNGDAMRAQIEQILANAIAEADSSATLRLVNNADWLTSLKYIEFLRDIGQHFSVNRMLTSESAKQRLERNQGLSFIEFNYHLLQSYDFLKLNSLYDCALQVGGDDQWFNILGGVDLVRRVNGQEAHALTVPLLATADGKKMGKTEKGAVWLDPTLCSPFDYFQYWLNVHDDDVVRFLKLYTFLDMPRIEELSALQGKDIRQAKRVLALEATSLVHGQAEAIAADEAAKSLFSRGANVDAPTINVSYPISVIDALVQGDLAKSKGAARRLIQQGGVRLNQDRVGSIDAVIEGDVTLWAGKKRAVQVRQMTS